MNTNLSDVGLMLDFAAGLLFNAVLPIVAWVVSVKLKKHSPQLVSGFVRVVAGGRSSSVAQEFMLWILPFLLVFVCVLAGLSMREAGQALLATLDSTMLGWPSVTLEVAPVSFKVAAAEAYIGTRLGTIYIMFSAVLAIWLLVTRCAPRVLHLRAKRGRNADAQSAPAA
ncbi:hypothetical protein [Mycobacteroides abscessus]|uniref:hypothetical protein n=1 Tax=Mycobacteroides abscessus TaxID=36809 RepID=UPI0012FFEA04|nr:hypothetical protein [Mycobacteroides abscessus]